MRVEINSDKFERTKDIDFYVNQKLKKLSKYMSKHLRESAHAIVMLKQKKSDQKEQYECEIILRLPPKEEMIAKETTVNMFAAIDIVESKLKSQLSKYKSKHLHSQIDRKNTFARLRQLADRDFWGSQD